MSSAKDSQEQEQPPAIILSGAAAKADTPVNMVRAPGQEKRNEIVKNLEGMIVEILEDASDADACRVPHQGLRRSCKASRRRSRQPRGCVMGTT